MPPIKSDKSKTDRVHFRVHPDFKALIEKTVQDINDAQSDSENYTNVSKYLVYCFMQSLGHLECIYTPYASIEQIANAENSDFVIINNQLCGYFDKKPRKVIFIGNEAWIYKIH